VASARRGRGAAGQQPERGQGDGESEQGEDQGAVTVTVGGSLSDQVPDDQVDAVHHQQPGDVRGAPTTNRQ
jgi:hypothetical protein